MYSRAADGDRLDDPALQSRFGVDQCSEHVTNPVAANDYCAGPVHEPAIRFVQRDDRLEIASVEVLLEEMWPIFRFVRRHHTVCTVGVIHAASGSHLDVVRFRMGFFLS